ncbi:hypothetical protein HYPSUDRAFT_911681 [Hypholoma sublateritium FD-334 SS-4]|uniref:Uncharacterized protein n=1 Tax=Hypholoma sublateritium (strain FD-334 SS-4) TaxID=945553 RepID=A0A0D2M6T5_HYPSF|nr:hypothetical protein HYPSUDRAFT_911681 [Hypholoma sublateritium FD-334 SS-4]
MNDHRHSRRSTLSPSIPSVDGAPRSWQTLAGLRVHEEPRARQFYMEKAKAPNSPAIHHSASSSSQANVRHRHRASKAVSGPTSPYAPWHTQPANPRSAASLMHQNPPTAAGTAPNAQPARVRRIRTYAIAGPTSPYVG